MKRISILCPVLALVFLMAVPVWAEETATTATTADTAKDTATTGTATTASAISDETITAAKDGVDTVAKVTPTDGKSIDGDIKEVEALKGLPVDKIDKIPSDFGLWWRSVKETLTLTFTWDEMSKAEKSLKFAEERMRVAKLIAEQAPDDAKAQEKAQKMIEKAQKFLDKVEAKKDKWSKDKSQEKIDKLVANIATQQSNGDVIMDELEKKLSGDGAQTISDLREKGAAASSRLLGAIANENISAETKAHLEEVKARIEAHAAEVKQYNADRKVLQEKIQNGDTSAKEDLQALKAERQTQIQVRTENVEDMKTRIEKQAGAGDVSAQKKLDIINKIQGSQTQEEGAAQENLQATTGSGSNNNVAAQDGEVQELSEKIKAVLEERDKASEEAAAAAAILGENKTDRQAGQ